MSQAPLRHYVEYSLPSRRIPAGEARVAEVQDRDIMKLDIPKRANSFSFYDAPAHITDLYETLNEQFNYSKRYLVAKKMLTHAEAIALDPKENHLAGKSTALEPGRRLTDAAIAAAVWDVKYDPKNTFALLRNGAIAQLRDTDTVINARKQQLWPPLPKPDAKAAFKKAAPKQSGLRNLKPPRFKPPVP